MRFPLSFRPKASYKTGRRKFNSRRGPTRRHAACDLVVAEGTPILAVADGTVRTGKYKFWHGTYAIEVTHPTFVARYCEIKGVADGIKRGAKVKEGQVIAYVGKMYTESMLHFELYSGKKSGPLTVRRNKPFERRADLLDPTSYLDKWPMASTPPR